MFNTSVWNRWRREYDNMSLSEQKEFHNNIEGEIFVWKDWP